MKRVPLLKTPKTIRNIIRKEMRGILNFDLFNREESFSSNNKYNIANKNPNRILTINSIFQSTPFKIQDFNDISGKKFRQSINFNNNRFASASELDLKNKFEKETSIKVNGVNIN